MSVPNCSCLLLQNLHAYAQKLTPLSIIWSIKAVVLLAWVGAALTLYPVPSYALDPLAAPSSQPELPVQQHTEKSSDLATQIVTKVHDFLEHHARTQGLEPSITITPPRLEHLSHCHHVEVDARHQIPLRSRMTVTVRCTEPAQWVTHVRAQLSAPGYYFVTNRTIEADEPIQLDDLIAHETDVLKLSPHILTDPSKIIGHIATHRIPSGTTLRANAVRNPQSIARGQLVQTIARGPGFVVSSEGQALQNGNPGARIQVRTASGQIIQGIVLDAHSVEVILP